MGLMNVEGKKPIKRKQHPEYDLMCQCYRWFKKNFKGCVFFQIPNEATSKRASWFANSGTLVGMTDCGIILKDKVLFIEFKAPKPHTSHISREQKEIANKIKFLIGNDSHYFVYSFEQFKEVVLTQVYNHN